MKKIIFFILFLASLPALAKADTSAVFNKQARDSVFRKAVSISVDSLRTQFLRETFQQYIGQKGATELLDSAITLSIRKRLPNEELWALYDYCRQYEYLTELPKLEQRLAILKDASYRHKIYAFYYTMWMAALQARCAIGDTEYAIMQAKEMANEAIRLKYEGGTFIASLTLAQVYSFVRQYDNAIETYEQALKLNPNANDDALIVIHANLSGIYSKLKKYPQALKELQLQHATLMRIYKKSQLSDVFRTHFLEIEISFCKIYMEIGDKENLRQHLKEAQKYYNENIFRGTYINYHTLWGAYYKFNKEWDMSLQEIDLALHACQGTEPFDENQILKMKANILLETGKDEEAANIYKIVAIKGDSLNQSMLNRHKEVHLVNHKIHKALLEKEILTQRYRYIQIGVGCIILVLLLFVIVRAVQIRRKLQRSDDETRLALEKIKSADKMKERFLHNITYEIRIPLNTVVGFSELLSIENNLSDEELEEYSTVVKNNSSRLLALINNILDLSRLEAGMMRFNVQECDIVQLCREAKMMMQMQTPDAVELTFNTELEELQVQVDSKWFLKLLTSLMSVPTGYVGERRSVEYSLDKSDKNLTIIVKGSPLYQIWKDEQEQNILHNINRLYVEAFMGRYQVLGEENKKQVFITYPLA